MKKLNATFASMTALLVWMGGSAPASADLIAGMGQLAGKVTSPKSAATGMVQALNTEKNVRYTVFISNGAYSFTNLFPGKYQVTVKKDGFTTAPITVEVKGGAEAKGDLTLKETAIAPTYVGGMTYPDAKVEPYEKIYPPGHGRDVLERTCMVCHGVNFFPYNVVRPAPSGRPALDVEGWALFVDYMHQEPAWHIKGNASMFDPKYLPAADRTALIQYLGRNFGPESAPRAVQKEVEPPVDEAALSKAMYIEYLVPNTAAAKERRSQQIDFYEGNIYYTDRGRPWYIVKLDPRTGAREDHIQPIGGGHGIAVDADGTVWYSGGGGAFAHYDPKSGLTDAYKIEGEPKLRSVTEIFDSKGDLWAGFLATAKLARWNRQTETITYYETPNGRNRPYGLIVDHKDNVWWSAYHDSSLTKFDPKTETFTRYPVTDKLTSMRRLGVDSKDIVWSATYGEEGGKGGSVVRLDPATGDVKMWKIPIPYSNPYDTGADPFDKIWSVTDNYLVNFDPTNEKFTLYPMPMRTDVPKITITAEGAIWFPPRNAGLTDNYGGGVAVLYPDKNKMTTLAAAYDPNSVWNRISLYKGPTTKVTGSLKCSPSGAKNAGGKMGPTIVPTVVGKLCEGAEAKHNSVGRASED
jgi:streptogramin lyase/mono/diheme cytochrome c family protein